MIGAEKAAFLLRMETKLLCILERTAEVVERKFESYGGFESFAVDNLIKFRIERENFMTIKCPKCQQDVKIDIAHAVDENGEVFMCPHCGYHFRYTER